jgi:hypothetical protein
MDQRRHFVRAFPFGEFVDFIGAEKPIEFAFRVAFRKFLHRVDRIGDVAWPRHFAEVEAEAPEPSLIEGEVKHVHPIEGEASGFFQRGIFRGHENDVGVEP